VTESWGAFWRRRRQAWRRRPFVAAVALFSADVSSSVRPSRASGRTGRDASGRTRRGASGRTGRGVVAGASAEGYDAVFVAVNGQEDMEQLAALKEAIKRDGAVWAVFRKARKDPSTWLRTGFNENDVLRGGLEAGLVDVKVVRLSETHTASKFVIRKAERR
jgi:hypothetical protein